VSTSLIILDSVFIIYSNAKKNRMMFVSTRVIRGTFDLVLIMSINIISSLIKITRIK